MKNYMTVGPALPTFWKTKGGLEPTEPYASYAPAVYVHILYSMQHCSKIQGLAPTPNVQMKYFKSLHRTLLLLVLEMYIVVLLLNLNVLSYDESVSI